MKTNLTDEQRLDELYHIVTELYSRETCGNCIVSEFINTSWINLCDNGIYLFQELKNGQVDKEV